MVPSKSSLDLPKGLSARADRQRHGGGRQGLNNKAKLARFRSKAYGFRRRHRQELHPQSLPLSVGNLPLAATSDRAYIRVRNQLYFHHATPGRGRLVKRFYASDAKTLLSNIELEATPPPLLGVSPWRLGEAIPEEVVLVGNPLTIETHA